MKAPDLVLFEFVRIWYSEFLQTDLTQSSNATRAKTKLPAQGAKEIPGSVHMRDVIPAI